MITILFIRNYHPPALIPIGHELTRALLLLVDIDDPHANYLPLLLPLVPGTNALQMTTVIQLLLTRVDQNDYDTAYNLALQIEVEADGFAWVDYNDALDRIEFTLRFNPHTETWNIEPKGFSSSTMQPPCYASLDELLGHMADKDPEVNASLQRRRRSPRRF